MNLDQTATTIDETWGIASPLPREHIPKRSRPKDQRILRIMGEIKKDWGFLKNSRTSILKSSRFQRVWHEARSTGITTRSSTNRRNHVHQKQNQNPSQTGTKMTRLDRFKSPEGTRRMGPPFPIKSNTNSHKSMVKSYSKERNGGRETQGRRPGRENNSWTSYKSHPT